MFFTLLEMLCDGFSWTANEVTKFKMHHWTICFALLLTVGFLCMRGLGVRGAR